MGREGLEKKRWIQPVERRPVPKLNRFPGERLPVLPENRAFDAYLAACLLFKLPLPR
jgi:hypothetical protein